MTLDGNIGLIIDIACLVILAAFIITNVIRGFFKRIFKFAVGIGAILIAYFFCDNLVNILESQFQILTKLSAKVVDLFDIPADVIQGNITETIKNAVESLNLPEFIAEAALNSLDSLELGLENSIQDVSLHISTVLTRYLLIGASFLVLYIISRLILALVVLILNKIVELPVISGVDKILGGVIGLIEGFLALTVIVYILSIIPGDAFESIRIMVSESALGGFFQRNNVLEAIVSAIVSKF